MKRIIGAFWALIACLIIAMCSGGCKTKKIASTEVVKRTYDSAQVVKERSSVRYSLIDTTKTSEYTRTITEYIFSVPINTDSVSLNGFNSGKPMLVRNADGSLQVNYGLRSVKQTVEASRSERKGISERKDSIGNRQSNTKVSATENKKQKYKQVEQVQISEPFDWWQLIIGASVLFAVVCLLLYLKRNKPKIKDFIGNIRNKIKQKLE